MSLHIDQHYSDDPFRTGASEMVSLSELFGTIESDERVLDRLGRALIRILAADNATLYLYDTSLSRVISHAHVGLSAEDAHRLDTVASVSPLAIPAERFVIDTRQTLVRSTAADFDRYPDPMTSLTGKLADVVVPIVVGHRVLGVAYVWRRSDSTNFGREAIDLAAACCRYAGLSLMGSRHLERLRALHRVSQTLAESNDQREIFQSAFDAISAILQADVFAFALRSGAHGTTNFRFMRPGEHDETEMPAGAMLRSIVEQVLRTGEFAPLATAQGQSQTGEVLPSALAVPMRAKGDVVGVLAVQSVVPHAYTDDDREVLETIAHQVAVALENARQYEEVERQRRASVRLAEWQQTLIAGTRILTQETDLGRMVDGIAAHLRQVLPHRVFAVYMVDRSGESLTALRVLRDGTPWEHQMTFPIDRGLIGAAVLEGHPICVNDSHHDPRSFDPPENPVDMTEGESFIGAPLMVDGLTVGAVAISREGSQPFTDEEFAAISAFTPHLAVALQTARLIARHRSLHLSTIRALTATIDARDPHTGGHSQRVAALARRIGVHLGLGAEELQAIELAGLLHDIGKIGVPDEMLSKAGALTETERVMMMAHAALGADILSRSGSPELLELVPLVRHHHEWYSGGGYPDGLTGEAIPFGASILSVSDAFDTMTTDRPYRSAMTIEQAITEMTRCSGTQFHPRVAESLREIIESGDPISLEPADDALAETVVGRMTPVDVRPVSVLHRIAQEIAGVSDLEGFLASVVIIIAEELNYSNASILMPSTSGDEMVVRADIWPTGETLVGSGVPTETSLTGWVFRNRAMANVGDVTTSQWFVSNQMVRTRSELAVPLMVENEVLGVLNVESDIPNAFTTLDERLLTLIASHVAPSLQLARLHDEVKRAATRDGLTGIFNHAAFYSRLEAHLNAEDPLALFIFDVEGLKRVNDTAGHLAGDNVLRRVAFALEMETRPEDMVARYGGDEFAVIAVGVDETTAHEMAKRLQQAVNELTWGPEAEFVSISVGVAVAGVDGTKATELVSRADARMYGARYIARSRRDAANVGEERRSTSGHASSR